MITEDNHDFEEIDDNQHIEEIEEAEVIDDESVSFDEVLQLTEYTGSDVPSNGGNSYVVAEYTNVDVVQVTAKHEKIAKQMVQKIKKFILDFDDILLTEDHKKYLGYVAELQLSQLSDLLSLTAINKQMLENMVKRINSVQAEDYAMLNTYNQLANQHLKFHKELQNTYKNIPAVLKKMRMEMFNDNQALPENNPGGGDEVVTEDFGNLQFNNSKQLLKSLQEQQQSTKQTN